jgi:hypothetical protein
VSKLPRHYIDNIFFLKTISILRDKAKFGDNTLVGTILEKHLTIKHSKQLEKY